MIAPDRKDVLAVTLRTAGEVTVPFLVFSVECNYNLRSLAQNVCLARSPLQLPNKLQRLVIGVMRAQCMSSPA